MGGWSAVLAIRRRGEREVADQRILGGGDFVWQIISNLDDLDDLVKKNFSWENSFHRLRMNADESAADRHLRLSVFICGSSYADT